MRFAFNHELAKRVEVPQRLNHCSTYGHHSLITKDDVSLTGVEEAVVLSREVLESMVDEDVSFRWHPIKL